MVILHIGHAANGLELGLGFLLPLLPLAVAVLARVLRRLRTAYDGRGPEPLGVDRIGDEPV